MKKSNVSFIAQMCEIKLNTPSRNLENVCFFNIYYGYWLQLLS